MSLPVTVAIWAVIVLLAAFAGIHLGYSGPRFAIALGVAAWFFAFEFFLAVPRVLRSVQAALGQRGAVLAALVPLFAVLIYSAGVGGNLKYTLIGAAYAVLPALLVAASVGRPGVTWADYAAAVIIWLPVEFRWMYRLFPFPPQLTHTLTILLALSTGVAAFVVLRRLEGIGYAIEWVRGTGWIVVRHFLLFAAIAVPLGIGVGFIAGRISISRDLAESFLTHTEESVVRPRGRVDCFRVVAHSSCAISELEIRDSCDDRGTVLRTCVDEKRLVATRRARTCSRRYFLAPAVSLILSNDSCERA
jgi:hypothetical protein